MYMMEGSPDRGRARVEWRIGLVFGWLLNGGRRRVEWKDGEGNWFGCR